MKDPVMICITAQESCEVIINKGLEMAKRLGTQAIVVSAQPKKASAEARSRDMKILDGLSKKTGAEVTVLYSDHPLISLTNYAAAKKPVHIFTGLQSADSEFVSRLAMMCEAPISMVSPSAVCIVPPTGV